VISVVQSSRYGELTNNPGLTFGGYMQIAGDQSRELGAVRPCLPGLRAGARTGCGKSRRPSGGGTDSHCRTPISPSPVGSAWTGLSSNVGVRSLAIVGTRLRHGTPRGIRQRSGADLEWVRQAYPT
jgi:hypothetical protein